MSVINDMLRDLEQRKAPERATITPADVAQLIEPQANNKRPYLMIAVLVIFVGVVFGAWMLQRPFEQTSSGQVEVPTESADSTERIAVVEPEPASKNPPLSVAPVEMPEPAGAPETKQAMAASPSDQINARPHAIQTEETTKSAQASSVVVPDPGSVPMKSGLMSQTKASVRKKEPVLAESKRHKIDTVEQTQTPAASKLQAEADPMAKHIVLSPELQDQQNAETALALFKEGNAREAYRQLYDYVAEHEYATKSRSVLAGYLLQDGRLAEAGDVLVRAPVEQDADLRQIKARWLLASGDETMALHTLSANLPELELHPDYYALLASYYQQFGYPEKAAQTYSMLVQYDASAANWWAGLGLALDSTERFVDAAKAYRRALQLPGLNQPVLDFIRTRLQVLNP